MTTVEDVLAAARAKLQRVSPAEAFAAVRDRGAVIVDIRETERQERDGRVPDAVAISRNVLEWRCAPQSAWRDPRVSTPRAPLIVMCNEGYQSSLAAAALQELGLPLATDMDGGFLAWRAAGLPVDL